MTDSTTDDDSGQDPAVATWLALDPPTEPGACFWGEVEATLRANVYGSTKRTWRPRPVATAAAVALLVVLGVSAAVTLRPRSDEVHVASTTESGSAEPFSVGNGEFPDLETIPSQVPTATTIPTATPIPTPLPLQVSPITSGTSSVCPETHPYAVVDADTGNPVDTRCLLPGDAPLGLFATARPGIGELVGGPRREADADTPGPPQYARSVEFTVPLDPDVDYRSFPVFDKPGGEERMLEYEFLDGHKIPYPLTSPTGYGQPLVLRVLELDPTGGWLRVQSPSRPKLKSTWVKAASFNLSRTQRRVEIDVGRNRLWVFDGGEVAIETDIVSGREDRPTTLQQTWVAQSVTGPSDAYGSLILILAAWSDSMNAFSGGLPGQSIHGTNRPELIPGYASSGSIRVENSVIEAIDQLTPPGTPVLLYDSRLPRSDSAAVIAQRPDALAATLLYSDAAIPPSAP